MSRSATVLFVFLALCTTAPAAQPPANRDVEEDPSPLLRTAKNLGVSPAFMLAFAEVAHKNGLAVSDSIDELHAMGAKFHEAIYGADNYTRAAMQQLRLPVPTRTAAGIDIAPTVLALSDAVASEGDPYTQEKMARMFDAPDMLPVLRGGSGPLVKEREIFEEGLVARHVVRAEDPY